jgi:hypothetical protein
MKQEVGDEFLLSRTYRLSNRTAVGQGTESTEQLDAQRGPASHVQI